MERARRLLKATALAYSSKELFDWDLGDLSRTLSHDQEITDTLTQYFHLFVSLTKPNLLPFVIDLPLGALPSAKPIKLLESRFLFVLFLLCFFQSQKSHHAFAPLIFLLHYRGLSHTGFHLLKSLGLSPVPKTVSKLTSAWANQCTGSIEELAVVWFDNIRRTQRGWVEEDVRVDHTVLAQTLLSVLPNLQQEEDCIFDEVPEILWSKTESQIRDAQKIRILRPGSPLNLSDSLSNPIRVADSPKYQFLEVEVLPIRCGEYLGTLEVLNALKEKGFWDFDTIRPLVVDYDLWWRIQRMILSNSTIGCFRTLRKKTLLIQGPWHLYKVLSEAFWKVFGPIFVYRVFLRTSSKNSPVASKTPELKQITETMIALWSWRRDHLLFEGHCHLARLIKLALNELVPLVRNSNQIVHFSTN